MEILIDAVTSVRETGVKGKRASGPDILQNRLREEIGGNPPPPTNAPMDFHFTETEFPGLFDTTPVLKDEASCMQIEDAIGQGTNTEIIHTPTSPKRSKKLKTGKDQTGTRERTRGKTQIHTSH
jgi:hypothetical protein